MPHKLKFTEDVDILTGPTMRPEKVRVKALPHRHPHLAVTQPSELSSRLSVTHLPSGLAIISGVSTRTRARFYAAILAGLPVDYSQSGEEVAQTIRQKYPEWFRWIREVQNT